MVFMLTLQQGVIEFFCLKHVMNSTAPPQKKNHAKPKTDKTEEN